LKSVETLSRNPALISDNHLEKRIEHLKGMAVRSTSNQDKRREKRKRKEE